ncbi:transporter [Linderina macrospora]|uniref:Transporter n=1 Tax=Linderina macrospora TaxID=4868 RepID=A0ACC1JF22_9FUNG|nr:transporter [Linderina macrospora]
MSEPSTARLDVPTDDESDTTIDETNQVMKSYLRKVDLRVAAFLCFGYGSVLLNRSATSFSKIQGIEKQLNMHGTQYNTLLALFYPTFLFFQLPLNLVYRKVGARLYIPSMLFFAGALSVCVLGVRTYSAMLAIRILEGCFQAGFCSAVFFTLSLWYPREYLATRTSWVISSTCLAGILFSAFSLCLSKLDTPTPIYSWQYLYLLVGLIACFSGIFGFVFIRDHPDTASFLTEQERALIAQVMSKNDLQASLSNKISVHQIIQGLTDWRLLMFMIIDFANNFVGASASGWAPVLLTSIGHTTTTSMLILLVSAILAMLATIATGWYAQRIKHIGYLQIALSTAGAVVLLIGVAGVHNKAARTISVFLLPILAAPACIVGPTWLNLKIRGTDNSAISNAFATAACSIGVFANSYAYLNTDAPLYIKGSSSNFAMFGAAILSSGVLLYNARNENITSSRASFGRSGFKHIQDQKSCS